MAGEAAPIDGTCPQRFARVQEAFAANFARHDDVGASVAVILDGELAVDLWGGWTSRDKAEPWARDTIVATFSSTKTVSALAALWLADRAGLDFDAPIQRVWPQFQSGEVSLRHCLAHTAGLPGWDAPLVTADLYDWQKCVDLLARQAPWWPPGTGWAYHALTQGYLLGEVVRRVDGRTIGAVVREELAGPLDADFHIGTGPEHDHRIAPIIPGPPETPWPADSLEHRIFANPPFDPGRALALDWRRAEIPAAGGFGAARGLARLMAILAGHGEVGGRQFMSAQGALEAIAPAWRGKDLSGMAEIGFGAGFALNLGQLRFGSGRCGFWGGAGGSLVIVDFDRRMAFAYVMNRLGGAPFGDPRNMALITAAYEALGAAQ